MPSPKSQYQKFGTPVLLSVNNFFKGAFPDVIFAKKSATGVLNNPRSEIVHIISAFFMSKLQKGNVISRTNITSFRYYMIVITFP